MGAVGVVVAPVNPASVAIATVNHLPLGAHVKGEHRNLIGLNPYQVYMPKDPAVEVYDLFESGKATAFLKAQFPEVDAFSTKTYSLYQFAKSLFLSPFYQEVNSVIRKRELSSDALDCDSKRIALRETSAVDISFVTEMNNSQCVRLDPTQYTVKVWVNGPIAIKKMCKVLKCTKDKFSILQDLIPCVDAAEMNRTYDTVYKTIINYIPSKYFGEYQIGTLLASYSNYSHDKYSFYNSSTWKYNQVFNTLTDSLHQCEQEELEPASLPIAAKIAMAVSGIVFLPGFLFTVYRLFRKKVNVGEMQPLMAQV